MPSYQWGLLVIGRTGTEGVNLSVRDRCCLFFTTLPSFISRDVTTGYCMLYCHRATLATKCGERFPSQLWAQIKLIHQVLRHRVEESNSAFPGPCLVDGKILREILGIRLGIPSFLKHAWKICCLPGAVRDTQITVLNQADKALQLEASRLSQSMLQPSWSPSVIWFYD